MTEQQAANMLDVLDRQARLAGELIDLLRLQNQLATTRWETLQVRLDAVDLQLGELVRLGRERRQASKAS